MRVLLRHFWRVTVLGIIGVSLVSVILMLWPAAGGAVHQHLDHVVRRHERLHFALHLAAGRTLSICPCTRPQAAVQYWKAAIHAPTPEERALVTDRRPRSVGDGPADLVTLLRYSGWVARTSPRARHALALLGVAVAAGGAVTVLALSRRPRGPMPGEM